MPELNTQQIHAYLRLGKDGEVLNRDSRCCPDTEHHSAWPGEAERHRRLAGRACHARPRHLSTQRVKAQCLLEKPLLRSISNESTRELSQCNISIISRGGSASHAY